MAAKDVPAKHGSKEMYSSLVICLCALTAQMRCNMAQTWQAELLWGFCTNVTKHQMGTTCIPAESELPDLCPSKQRGEYIHILHMTVQVQQNE